MARYGAGITVKLNGMKGAIAAGPSADRGGGRPRAAGGRQAVDACVAAAFVSWVCESPLTGPGGGGFMLVHEAASAKTAVLDFFVTVPRGGGAGASCSSWRSTSTATRSSSSGPGAAAVAVPGTALGLEEAHRRWGRVPWAELVAPAAALAREGFELTPVQGYLHAILDGLLRHSPEGDAMYGARGAPYGRASGSRSRSSATTLDRLAEEGASVLYTGDLAERDRRARRGGGGALALDDLAAYEVIEREPVSVEYRGHEFRSNPPPSSGGVLIALGLQALGEREPTPSAIADAMEAQEAARDAAFARALYSGDCRAAGAEGHDAHLRPRRGRQRGVAQLVARARAPASSSRAPAST